MARELRELRREHRLTRKQLAAASDIDHAEVSRIERGLTDPSVETLAALLAPLGARIGIVPRESCDESEVGADSEAEAVAAERVRSGAAQGA